MCQRMGEFTKFRRLSFRAFFPGEQTKTANYSDLASLGVGGWGSDIGGDFRSARAQRNLKITGKGRLLQEKLCMKNVISAMLKSLL